MREADGCNDSAADGVGTLQKIEQSSPVDTRKHGKAGRLNCIDINAKGLADKTELRIWIGTWDYDITITEMWLREGHD